MNSYELNLNEALEMLELHSTATSSLPILAGGTDYFPALQEKAAHTNVLDITRIRDLNTIESLESGWRIAAGVTWSQLVGETLPPVFDALKLAAVEVGSIQIQNRGTLVGNVCNASPAADGVPALLAMDAKVEIQSAKQTRQLPLAQFIQGVRQVDLKSDEMVTALVIPHPKSSTDTHTQSHFYKLGSRRYLVISIVMAATKLTVDRQGSITDAAIAVGSCSAVAARLTALEQALVGRNIVSGFDSVLEASHLKPLTPINDIRGSAEYRLDVAAEIISRALSATADKFANGAYQ